MERVSNVEHDPNDPTLDYIQGFAAFSRALQKEGHGRGFVGNTVRAVELLRNDPLSPELGDLRAQLKFLGEKVGLEVNDPSQPAEPVEAVQSVEMVPPVEDGRLPADEWLNEGVDPLVLYQTDPSMT